MKEIPVAMTIAGSDSGGGAGIQADLKTFAALGVYGTSAITSVTAQNTYTVRTIYDLPPEIIESQIITVHEDIGIDSAKTGMLSNKDIIGTVAKVMRELHIPLVVDPVMIAKSGSRLLRQDAIEALTNTLLREAIVVTPNIFEAEVLSGIKINNLNDMKDAALIIYDKYHPQAVLVKGGHLQGNKVTDVLYYKNDFHKFEHPRIFTNNNHGSGCTFSAAITAYLAKGTDLVTSIDKAIKFISKALTYSLSLGKGYGPVNPISELELPAEKLRVLENVEAAINILLINQEKINKLVPEVGLNIGMSLPYPYAKSVDDIASVPGRISKYKNGIIVPRKPEFGVSKHIATVILTIMKFDKKYRSAANIAYSDKIEMKAIDHGFDISSFDRREEPYEIKTTEGMTTVWGVTQAVVKKNMKIPDLIIDYGEYGKEPLVFVIGHDAIEVAEKIVKISSLI